MSNKPQEALNMNQTILQVSVDLTLWDILFSPAVERIDVVKPF